MAHSIPSRAIRLLLLSGLALGGLGLAGCGLQPLYSGGGSGAVAQGLASVAVSPIPGRDGLTVLEVGRRHCVLRSRRSLRRSASGLTVATARSVLCVL